MARKKNSYGWYIGAAVVLVVGGVIAWMVTGSDAA